MAISPNGKYLVSGGVEGLLKVWDPLDLVLIKNLFCSTIRFCASISTLNLNTYCVVTIIK